MLLLLFQITRSVSSISAMRGKHESSANASSAAGMSEVASAETCYGVFRKLEPDDYYDGGGARVERVIAGRSPPLQSTTTTTTTTIAFSPQEPALAYVTASVADDDYDDNDYGDCCDYGDFDPGTCSVYTGGGSSSCCDTTTTTAATAATPIGAAKIDVASSAVHHRSCCLHEDRLCDFVWDGYGCPATTAVVVGTTADDLRRIGGAVAPFTPMGSTTKLVGIDANSDDTPKVCIYVRTLVTPIVCCTLVLIIFCYVLTLDRC